MLLASDHGQTNRPCAVGDCHKVGSDLIGSLVLSQVPMRPQGLEILSQNAQDHSQRRAEINGDMAALRCRSAGNTGHPRVAPTLVVGETEHLPHLQTKKASQTRTR